MGRIKVQLRVKHLILLMLLLGLILWVAFQQSLIYMVMGKVYEHIDADKANVYYARSVEKGGWGSLESAAARADFAAAGGYSYTGICVYSSDGASGSSEAQLKQQSVKKLNQEYKTICENYKGGDRFAAYQMKVAILNYRSGEKEKARSIVEAIAPVRSKNLQDLLVLNAAGMHMVDGEYEEGIALLDRITAESDQPCAGFLRAFQSFMTGDLAAYQKNRWKEERAPDYDTLKAAGKYSELAEPLLAFHELQRGMDDLIEIEKTSVEPGAGAKANQVTVRVNMPEDREAVLFLSLIAKEKANIHTSSTFAEEGIVSAVRADRSGNYVLEHVPSGEYQLRAYTFQSQVMDMSVCYAGEGTDENMQQDQGFLIVKDGEPAAAETINVVPVSLTADAAIDRDGNVRMEAQNLPEADRYQLSLVGVYRGESRAKDGSTQSSYLSSTPLYISPKAVADAVTVPIAGQYELMNMYGFTQESIIDFANYFPFFYGEKTVRINVKGFDRDGSLLFDTSKIGMGSYEDEFCSSRLRFTEETEADRKLLAGDVQGAIPLYEKAAEDGDLNSMGILAILYSEGYLHDPEAGDQDPLGGRDQEKALFYLKKLEEAVPDSESVKSRREWVADHFEDGFD